MDKEMQEKIFARYPKIFQDRTKPMTESCMFWGLDIGPGWEKIIDKLCHLLQWYTDKNGYPQVIADQVKEKFSGLRFYHHTVGGDEKRLENQEGFIEGAIEMAEHWADCTCEHCGKEGTLCSTGKGSVRGWLKTLCPDCTSTDTFKDYAPIKEDEAE